MKPTNLFFSKFTNLYSQSKTLRFELKPQGRTLEHINAKGLITEDELRSEKYKQIKKIIDAYHKWFISKALANFELSKLDEYLELYNLSTRDDKQTKAFEALQKDLRKQVATRLKKDESFKSLDKSDLFKGKKDNEALLCNFIKNLEETEIKELGFETKEDAHSIIKDFERFTTYFTGFHENRKNMYSDEDKGTAIANRLIHENLPKFIDNLKIFEKVAGSEIKDQFQNIQNDLNQHLEERSVEYFFSIEAFNLTLTQQGIELYNLIVGGFSKEKGDKIQGINEYINLHNQKAKKKDRIPKLKPLFKQILSDRATASFVAEAFEEDNEVLEQIEKTTQHLIPELLKTKELLSSLSSFESDKIYIQNNRSLTDISQQMFGSWSILNEAMQTQYDACYSGKKEKGTEKYEEEREKHFKKQKSFTIAHLDNCVSKLSREDLNPKTIESYFASLGKGDNESETLFHRIDNAYISIKGILNTPWDSNSRKLRSDKATVNKIKNYLDRLKELQMFLKPLLGNGDESEKDERFYSEFTAIWETLDIITPLYNRVRNYMTQKPYSTEKFKLNFENSTLLDGWDVNKETDNTAVLLKKGGNFFLGIMDKAHNKVFRKVFDDSELGSSYQKVEYKLLPGVNKMLPKVFFSKSRIDEFAPHPTIVENYKKETHKKGDSFSLNDCHKLIDFFKASIKKHEDWQHFDFQFSPTETYQDLSGFYREVEHQGYKLTFRNIAETYLNELVDTGKLYLFQIYNKDFSPHSKGTPNLHTIYWKMLFDEQNLADIVYKLNGQAEVFYRKASISEQDRVVHRANEPIKRKNKQRTDKESLFVYDITKDKRFTVDKFQFHVPITMNFKGEGLPNLNERVNQHLYNNSDTHIIGIDRGERHLLYLTIINLKGEIQEQFSLNEIIHWDKIRNEKYTTNYHSLLNEREGSRDQARKDWKTIENIKELKEGYLSHVIHAITQIMIQYNAIVVLEDLNFGFMRGRQKVEKQVYQKFEKMLIDKLNYLVDKQKDSAELGGPLQALQLTNQFKSFQKLGKQSGFLYYVPAWNTSKMDPETGFVNLLDTRYKNIEEAQRFFGKFESIQFEPQSDRFVFKFDYNSFHNKAEGSRTEWEVVADHSTRYRFDRTLNNGHGGQRKIDVAMELKELFSRQEINFTNGGNLISQISNAGDKTFFVELLRLLSTTLYLRHNNGKKGAEEEDFILSPVANSSGVFFDSRQASDTQPKDADANGAYNIARKGLWIIEQLKPTGGLGKINLAISNKDWLKFAQS